VTGIRNVGPACHLGGNAAGGPTVGQLRCCPKQQDLATISQNHEGDHHSGFSSIEDVGQKQSGVSGTAVSDVAGSVISYSHA
tara:strand:+ start:129 stop:374 length:246 start_codon:yes stop_codon:yes gene_type:complete